MAGRVEETYAAALQRDIYGGDATLVGVGRRPTGWFRAPVDENHPEPEPLNRCWTRPRTDTRN